MGRFSYTGNLVDASRENTWAELGLTRDLWRDWDMAASYRNDWGDDITGRRFFLELARRF